MKSFLAFAAIFAVAVAGPLGRDNKPVTNVEAELAAIVTAINSPSTDPATAALLEEQLASIIAPSPVSVEPVVVSPISVGPAIVDFPLPDGGAVTAVEPAVVNPLPVIEPSPVVIGEIPPGATPLVQIIVNVKAPESPVPAPTPVGQELYVPGPVNVVDNVYPVVVEPVQVVEPVVVDPVQVVEPVIVEPVDVVEPVIVEPVDVAEPVIVEPVDVAEPVIVEPVDVAEPVIVEPVDVAEPVIVEPVDVAEPVIVEPVDVGTPIIPAPAVVIPDELN